MSTVPVYTLDGKQAGEIELAEDVFGLAPNDALVHQAVVTTLANQRQGTADTKTRGEVHHTTKKAYKQKGTGRARQGMRSAPHWKGGGVVFGPHPRDYGLSFPKKMRRRALLSVLSAKASEGAIVVLQELNCTQAKTKEAVAVLKALELQDKRVLLVLSDHLDTVERAFRNLPNVAITTAAGLGTYDMLLADRLLFTQASLLRLQTLKQQPFGTARWTAKQQQGGAE